MFRVFLLPLIVFVILAMLISLVVYLYTKIRNALRKVLKKSSDLAEEQRRKRSEQSRRNELPERLQKSYRLYDSIQIKLAQLPERWNVLISPLVEQSGEILETVSASPKRLDSVRGFFNHTLDSLAQLIDRLLQDYQSLDELQEQKVKESLEVFKTDLSRHRTKLKRLKKLDFDVLMDVIKARLRS